MGRLLGTDGVRGVANKDLTCELAMKLGRAAAAVLTNKSTRHPRVIIGKDTRLSSDMLENAMAAGLCSVGASVVLLGVVPTPAVAYLVEKYKADAGIMISASHNSYEYNGIKIFSGDGFKLPDDLEERIEALRAAEELAAGGAGGQRPRHRGDGAERAARLHRPREVDRALLARRPRDRARLRERLLGDDGGDAVHRARREGAHARE